MSNNDFTITDKLRGLELSFKTTHDLFSYRKIDDGTRLLIETLQVNRGDTCLDLGCGYGAVGIVIAKLNFDGKVYFVDRDFVAVEYSKTNCQLNNVHNFEARLSNGFSNLSDIQFDLIASNLPTHIAREALEQIISDAEKHLKKDGRFYIVSTTRLRPFIQRLLEPVFNNYERIASNNNYSISLVRKSL